jgi:peptidyl-prolyl cis-trans isomerase SurA
MRPTLRTLLFALASSLVLAPGLVTAQGLFSPAYIVNDKVVTNYEIDQRAKLLALLRAPGDPVELARKQLVEERLKIEAAQALGLTPKQDEIEAGMAEFAGRVNLDTEQFLQAIGSGGVSKESFVSFVQAGIAWRSVVQARFARKVQVSERDVDRAIQAAGSGSAVRVLLSEIIIPADPANAAAVQEQASELSQITSLEAFARAARQYSAAPTRGTGGKINWMPISNLPPALRPAILALAPGQVTDPIPLPNAVAVFQLRAIEETGSSDLDYAAIEYATYLIPGAQSGAAQAEAAKIKANIDTCDDLYGVAKGKSAELLERVSKKPAEIPADIALELAKLDRHEVSTALTRGDALMMVMLCTRTPAIAADVVREDVIAQLQNSRLERYANGYLEELKADARIIEK